ncbi:MAG: hypothetical protein ACRDD8_05275 [Bacteroidales bacterium]
MPRKSSIKSIVDGVPIREFLLKSLVTKTYRTLLKDEIFKTKTGIRSLGNFYNQTEKLDINITAIYTYGVDNLLIHPDESMEAWINRTRKNYNTSKILSEREMYCKIGEQVGLCFDDSTPKDTIRITLLDFLGEDELNTRIQNFKGGK